VVNGSSSKSVHPAISIVPQGLAGDLHARCIGHSWGDTESPAFSEFAARVTVLEDTLFETADSRKANLAQRYGQLPGGLLDYAVSHEMGHAICHERDEKLADSYGLALRMGTTPICGGLR
jgi:hypothetical protein